MGSHGGGAPPPAPLVDTTERDRQEADAAAAQNQFAKKRRGVAGTRLTDPVTDLSNGNNKPKSRVSLLGGGEYSLAAGATGGS